MFNYPSITWVPLIFCNYHFIYSLCFINFIYTITRLPSLKAALLWVFSFFVFFVLFFDFSELSGIFLCPLTKMASHRNFMHLKQLLFVIMLTFSL